MQLRHEEAPYAELCCPFCSQLTTGRSWEELSSVKDADLQFTPCKFVAFEESGVDLPVRPALSREGRPTLSRFCWQVYFNEQKNPGGKPKWKIRQGIGPAALELSRAKNNCLFKKSLADTGITDGTEYDPEAAGRCEYSTDGTAVPDKLAHKEIAECVLNALRCRDLGSEDRMHLLEQLGAHKPLYEPDHWAAMEDRLTALAAATLSQEEADAREDVALGFGHDRGMAELAREAREAPGATSGHGGDFDDFM